MGNDKHYINDHQYVRADKDVNPDACTNKDSIERTIYTEKDLGVIHGKSVTDSGMKLVHGEAKKR